MIRLLYYNFVIIYKIEKKILSGTLSINEIEKVDLFYECIMVEPLSVRELLVLHSLTFSWDMADQLRRGSSTC